MRSSSRWSGGSNRLRSAILQAIRYVVDYGMTIEEAVAGRMHNESGILHVEGDFDDAALTDLERRGYQLLRWKGVNLFFGGVHAAYGDPATGELSGAGARAATAQPLQLDLAVPARVLGDLLCLVEARHRVLEQARQESQPRLLGAKLQ